MPYGDTGWVNIGSGNDGTKTSSLPILTYHQGGSWHLAMGNLSGMVLDINCYKALKITYLKVLLRLLGADEGYLHRWIQYFFNPLQNQDKFLSDFIVSCW